MLVPHFNTRDGLASHNIRIQIQLSPETHPIKYYWLNKFWMMNKIRILTIIYFLKSHKKGKRCKHYSVILMPQTSTPHSVTWMLVGPKVWKCFLTQIKLKSCYHHISSEVWFKTTQKEREVIITLLYVIKSVLKIILFKWWNINKKNNFTFNGNTISFHRCYNIIHFVTKYFLVSQI